MSHCASLAVLDLPSRSSSYHPDGYNLSPHVIYRPHHPSDMLLSRSSFCFASFFVLFMSTVLVQFLLPSPLAQSTLSSFLLSRLRLPCLFIVLTGESFLVINPGFTLQHPLLRLFGHPAFLFSPFHRRSLFCLLIPLWSFSRRGVCVFDFSLDVHPRWFLELFNFLFDR